MSAAPSTEFDAYVAVDWSANSKPKTGPDSIWIAWAKWHQGHLSVGEPVNPSTRDEATRLVIDLLRELVAAGARVLMGCDFAYGYPSGLAEALSASDGNAGWRAVWNELERLIVDRPNNANNRFEVASAMNVRLEPPGPFWACPSRAGTPALRTKRSPYPHVTPNGVALSEYRVVEQHLRSTGRCVQSPWKLFTSGSVGSQALLGIPHLARVRREESLRERSCVWPFETGFGLPAQASRAGVVHVEMWPGLFGIDLAAHRIKDAAQVLSVVREFARLDAAGRAPFLFAPAALPATEVRRCVNEEGWIFGA